MTALKKLRCCIKDNTILPPASILDKNGNEITQVKTSSGEILWGKYNVKVLDKTNTYNKVTELSKDWYKDSSKWEYYFTKVIKSFSFYVNEYVSMSDPEVYFSAWNIPAYRHLFGAYWDTVRNEVTTSTSGFGPSIYHGEKITKEAELRPEAGFYFTEAINPSSSTYGNSLIIKEVVSQADGEFKIDLDSLKIEPRYGTLELENSTGFNFQCGLDRVSSLKQDAKIGTVLDDDYLYYGDSFLYDVNDVADTRVPGIDAVYPEIGSVIECSLTNLQDGNGTNFTEINPEQTGKVSYLTERGSKISFDLSPNYPLYFETTPAWKSETLPKLMGVDGKILSTVIMGSDKGSSLEANLVVNPYYPKSSVSIPIYFYSSNREFSIAGTKITADNSSSSVTLTAQNIQEVPEDDFSKAVWSHLVTKRQVAVKKDAYYTVLEYASGIIGLPPTVRLYSLSEPSYCYFNYTNNGYLYHVDLVDNPGKTTIIENKDISLTTSSTAFEYTYVIHKTYDDSQVTGTDGKLYIPAITLSLPGFYQTVDNNKVTITYEGALYDLEKDSYCGVMDKVSWEQPATSNLASGLTIAGHTHYFNEDFFANSSLNSSNAYVETVITCSFSINGIPFTKTYTTDATYTWVEEHSIAE